MKQILAITKKEIRGYFGSPIALIFVGVFLAITLYFFFWAEPFFARSIADVRPLFRRMPSLMIFLVAVLTMRQWSEEQRAGTLEVLLTLPVSSIQLVIGKFLAVLALVVFALALTIFLPLTVAMMGNLDWGPVVGGYLATVLLAAAYAAIGLFVSSRTDSQTLAAGATIALCELFYLIGSPGVTDFFGNVVGEVLRALSPLSRFESIERGVVDLRDLLYYLSLTGVFLALNVLSLISKRWSKGTRTRSQRRSVTLTSALLVANLVLVNVWFYPLVGLRLDLTEYHEYSLSQVTRDLLDGLQEPLLIRGYFSEKTHPKLAPLVPTVRDLLREYEIAAKGKVELEIVDPAQDPEAEAEANQVYGIRPTPFQVTDRYEASVINSYFDILIRYGDQSQTLSFNDLIEVESRRDGIDVRLRNFEYDMTRSIKKVVYGFQSLDAVLAALDDPANLTLYLTPATLPEWLAEAPATIEKVASEIASESSGNFTYTVVDPTAADSPITPQELYDVYGLQPYPVALFAAETYYLHMILQIGDEAQGIYPQGELSEADVRTAIESALKRASPGFLKVAGLWTPPATPTQDMFGQMQEPLSSWQQVGQFLRQEYEVRQVDLTTGQIPTDIDVLVVVGPQNLTEVERFAIDQYLMRGGSVVVAAGNYTLTYDQMSGGLGILPVTGGVQDILAHYGVTVEQKLVMDPQNEPFPVPVVRDVGGFQVQEIETLDYPFFVDVRSDGMASGHPIVANLPAVTVNWVSPITLDDTLDDTLDEEKNADREVTVLLQSSPESWTQTDANIQPQFELYPETGFAVGFDQQSSILAVAIQGSFESFFKDQPSPLASTGEEGGESPPPESVPATIESSPDSARLVVVGSAEFLDDIVFEISSTLSRERYLNSLQFLQNAVSWSTEDLDLLTIRSRGTSARVLAEMTERAQSFWEGANYGLALLALVIIGFVWNAWTKQEEPMDLAPPPAATQTSHSTAEATSTTVAAATSTEVEDETA